MKIIHISILLIITLSESKSSDNFINVSGTGALQAKANQLKIKLGVSKTTQSTDSSVLYVRKIEDKLFKLCEYFKIPKANISTHMYKLNRDYKNSRDTTTYLGIKAYSTYKIVIDDIKIADEFLSKSFAIGINVFDDVRWIHKNIDSLKIVTSKKAVKDAYKNAKYLLVNSNRKIGKLISASYEKPNDFDVRSHHYIDDMLGGLLGGDDFNMESKDYIKYFKLIPGKINVNTTVYVKYSIK